MKIRKAISIFKKLLSIYEEHEDKWFVPDGLLGGLCFAEKYFFGTRYLATSGIFRSRGYYGAYLISKEKDMNYLFPPYIESETLKPRIKFLRAEIESLNDLLKKGYTDI